jgi:dihydroflavonol-4-reductase
MEFASYKRVKMAFVTGGTGFVGANLVRLLLQEGYGVKVLARANSSLLSLKGLNVEIVNGDLIDSDLASKMQGCKFLFHVAAHYSLYQSERSQLIQANVVGTRNVLAAAMKAGIERTVYTSSVAAIGINPQGITNESYQSPIAKLIGAYKQSKFLAEQEAIKAAKEQEIVIVNPATPIGAWDSKPTPTGEIILRFLRRQMPFYMHTGLNFIDVQDVARGHLLALQKGISGDRYILGNQNLTLLEFLQLLEAHTGLPAPKNQIPGWIPLSVAWIEESLLAPLGRKPTVAIDGVRMAGQMMYYDATKAREQLGLPQTPINLAIQTAIDWYRANNYSKHF